MRAFARAICGRLVTFQSVRCVHREAALGVVRDAHEIAALEDRLRCPRHELSGCIGAAAAQRRHRAGPTGPPRRS